MVGFGKTKEIAPGASETVTVLVDKRDLAAYDTYGAGTYILDAGDYYFTAATDSHNAVNNILAAKGFTVETTENRMDADGNAAYVYKWEQAEFDSKTYATSKNGTEITNQLSNADPNLYEGVAEEVKWLSRQDWEGTFPKEIVKLQLTGGAGRHRLRRIHHRNRRGFCSGSLFLFEHYIRAGKPRA